MSLPKALFEEAEHQRVLRVRALQEALEREERSHDFEPYVALYFDPSSPFWLRLVKALCLEDCTESIRLSATRLYFVELKSERVM